MMSDNNINRNSSEKNDSSGTAIITATTTTKTTAPNPLTCSSFDLADFLLKNRFENDAMATTTFLLECTASLPNAESISEQLTAGIMANNVNNDNDNDNDSDDEKKNTNAKNKAIKMLGDKVTIPSELLQLLDNKSNNRDNNDTNIEVAGTVPRCSKLNLTCYTKGIRFAKPSAAACNTDDNHNDDDEVMLIPRGAVSHLIAFPRPEDCRRAAISKKTKSCATIPPPMLLMVLQQQQAETSQDKPMETENGKVSLSSDNDKEAVKWKGKALQYVCIRLVPPTSKTKSKNEATSLNDGDSPSSSSSSSSSPTSILCQLVQTSLGLKKDKVIHIANPNDHDAANNKKHKRWCFQAQREESSSTTTGGMPFVSCYHGVKDGAVYPLEEGLLFFKPPLFIPRSQLHSIACGRGSGGSRYVDLVLSLVAAPPQKINNDSSSINDNDDLSSRPRVEFTNISREELQVLNAYIHKVLIVAMKRDVECSGSSSSKKNGSEKEANNNNNNSETMDEASSDDDDDDDDYDDYVVNHDNGDDEDDDDDYEEDGEYGDEIMVEVDEEEEEEGGIDDDDSNAVVEVDEDDDDEEVVEVKAVTVKGNTKPSQGRERRAAAIRGQHATRVELHAIAGADAADDDSGDEDDDENYDLREVVVNDDEEDDDVYEAVEVKAVAEKASNKPSQGRKRRAAAIRGQNATRVELRASDDGNDDDDNQDDDENFNGYKVVGNDNSNDEDEMTESENDNGEEGEEEQEEEEEEEMERPQKNQRCR